MKKVIIAFNLALLATGVSWAQQNSSVANAGTTMVSKENKAELDRQSKKGTANVNAVKTTSDKFSREDQNLMLDVVKGNMILLEAGKVAVKKASSDDVRKLAQAEVDEQTSLAAKLKEIADAKIVTLPSVPDGETQILVAKLEDLSGAEFDKTYVLESSVAGHEKLDKVLATITADASDASLKGLAQAAHPLVKTHLKAAKEMVVKWQVANTPGSSQD